jgi:hypothetical protein
MLKISYLILLLLNCAVYCKAQLEPNDKEALITFRLYSPDNNMPWANMAIKVNSKNSTKVFELNTDLKGEASALLPINNIYTLHLSDLPNFGDIEVGNGSYQKHFIPIPYDGKIVNTTSNKNLTLNIQLIDKAGKGVARTEKIELKDQNGKIWKISTDINGRTSFSTESRGPFTISFQGATDYYKFKIPNNSNVWEERIILERKPGFTLFPSIDKGLLNFHYVDFQNKPLKGESFQVTDKVSGQIYNCTTNNYGIAQVLVPLNRVYQFSTFYNPHFDEMEVKLREGFHIFEFDIFYQSPSSEAWKIRIEELESISALKDSISTLAAKQKIVEENNSELSIDSPIPLKNRKTFYIRRNLEQKAELFRDSLAQNPKVFEQHNSPVLATLNRIQNRLKDAAIVTDVTSSMDPYIVEVLVWHALNLSKGNYNRYVFFNDGDDKLTNQKVIGKTGGLYFSEGKLENLDSIISKMQQATAPRMGGGEPPENDIEALLGAVRFDSIKEIILIADAHSRVRDMELLCKIKLPVRIILCGAEEQNRFYINKRDINEQYLTIAHRTGGSVHTLLSDILDLSKKLDGDVVELQGIRYLLRNRQFVRI